MSIISNRSLLGAALAVCPLMLFAQAGSLSDTLNSGMSKGDKAAQLSFRTFNENEAKTYGNLALYYGFSHNIDLVLRASAAEFTNVGGTRTGGTDIELQGIWRKNSAYVALGVAKPSTPSTDQPVVTFTVGAAGQHEGQSAFAGVTGVTSDDVTMIGAAFAFRTPVWEKVSLDVTSMFLIRGENTSNTLGQLEREPVFNFALMYTLDERQSFWLSAGNSLGDTTGFSMSHRVQRGFGLGAGLKVRF